MTDRQLAILIRAWGYRLTREIALVRDALPSTLPRRTERVEVYKDSGLMARLAGPDHYEDQEGDYCILEGLEDLATELAAAAETLDPPREEGSGDAKL